MKIRYRPYPRKTVFSNDGLTLSELLIASTIVTIVFLGLGVGGLAMRKMDSGYTRDTTLYMKLEAIGQHIRMSASKAVGIRTDPGIFVDTSIYDMCFRIAPDTIKPWRCYSRFPNDAGDKTKLYFCDVFEPGACIAHSNKYLGELNRDVFSTPAESANSCNMPSFTVDDTNNLSFRFKIFTRRDNSGFGASPDCSSTLDKGTEENPQEVIAYTIYPEAHSF